MSPEPKNTIHGDDLMLLSFWIMGIRLAVDAGQVLEIRRPADIGDKTIRITRLQETMRFVRQGSGYKAPRVLIPRMDPPVTGLEVDCLENVMSIGLESIFPLPSLISGFHSSLALWGVAVSKTGLILLVDLFRLARNNQTDVVSR